MGEEFRPPGLVPFFQLISGTAYVAVIAVMLKFLEPQYNLSHTAKGIVFMLLPFCIYHLWRWYSRALFTMFNRIEVSEEDLMVRGFTGIRRLEWCNLDSVHYKPSKQALRFIGVNGEMLDVSEDIEPLHDFLQFVVSQHIQKGDSSDENLANIFHSSQRYIAFRKVVLGIGIFVSIGFFPLLLMFLVPFFVVVRFVEFSPEGLTIHRFMSRCVQSLDNLQDATLELGYFGVVFRPTLVIRLHRHGAQPVDIPFSGKSLLPLATRLRKIAHTHHQGRN